MGTLQTSKVGNIALFWVHLFYSLGLVLFNVTNAGSFRNRLCHFSPLELVPTSCLRDMVQLVTSVVLFFGCLTCENINTASSFDLVGTYWFSVFCTTCILFSGD